MVVHIGPISDKEVGHFFWSGGGNINSGESICKIKSQLYICKEAGSFCINKIWPTQGERA
ncbi:MAG: hypothetical protein H6Q42_735 [Deltaproteobacteria bacterium]|nr:hypothetical protein [Deltaproteobacteria bacterium]